MNYLAHLHLGGQRPEELLGSLYGDFVKGPLQGEFRPGIESGIQLHRSIDAFTDAHPLVGQALSRFTHTRRRYAGIVLDVFFDHCLARDWGTMPMYRWSALRRVFIVCWGLSRSCPADWRPLHRTWPPTTGWAPIRTTQRWSGCLTGLPDACHAPRNWRAPCRTWMRCISL